MSALELQSLNSPAQLRAIAPHWDALWQRSDVTLPTARAELAAQWLECFGSIGPPQILVVWQGEQLVAALPLIGRTLRALITVGDLTLNYWSPNGELLLDPAADAEPVLGLLVAALGQSPWALLWLEMIPLETPRWQAFLSAARRGGLAADAHPRYAIGQVEIAGAFDDYLAARSDNLRRSLRKDAARLEREGPLELVVHRDFTPEEVDHRLRRAFELESRGWKGAAGGSVLGTPGMFEFYSRQAQQLAQWGQLRVAFLEQHSQAIAFEIGWIGKGVYHSYKVGYHPDYRPYGPGHLLRMHLIRDFHEHSDCRAVDFQGPLTDALAAWSTRTYAISRLVLAPPRLRSAILMRGYKVFAPLARWRRRTRPKQI